MSEKPPKKPLPPHLDDKHPDTRSRLVSLGGPVRDSTVSLRIFGDELDPGEMTRMMGCPPSEALRKGDVIPDPRYHRTAKTGSWILESDQRGAVPLETQIDRLLSRVTDDLAVWAELSRRYQTDLFCGVFLDAWNRGLELDPGLLRKVADRGLTLGIDIYSPDP